MRLSSFLPSALLFASSVLAGPTPTTTSPDTLSADLEPRWATDGFVGTKNGDFVINGKTFFFAGTNAYWLSQLNTEADIVSVLENIASKGLKVVRTWCFREVVGTPPSNPATYTTLWDGSTQKFNQPGIDRLNFILQQANNLGLKIHCSLTNNWDPKFPADAPRPAGYYSNSYGGIDTYVNQITGGKRDDFYTHPDVIAAYKNFLSFIVPQFKSTGALFAWELANDPRCQGAVGTSVSGSCNPHTITKWTAQLSAFLKTLDPNHLVASGDAGFFCAGCPKLFPKTIPASPSGGKAARDVGLVSTNRLRRRVGYLTKADVINMSRDIERILSREARAGGVKNRSVRGSWAAPAESSFNRYRGRQDSSTSGSFDGSQGVDSEDISNIPSIGFTTFQLFPDQNSYGTAAGDSSGPPAGGAGGANIASTIQEGVNWITAHAQSAQTFGKPTSMTAFGLVNQDNSQAFTAEDSTTTGVNSATSVGTVKRDGVEKRQSTTVASDSQQQTAYSTWTSNAVNQGVHGITHYQWGKSGLTSQTGTVVDNSNTSGDSSSQAATNGLSPNDGYATTSSAIQGILSNVASEQNAKSGQDSS